MSKEQKKSIQFDNDYIYGGAREIFSFSSFSPISFLYPFSISSLFSSLFPFQLFPQPYPPARQKIGKSFPSYPYLSSSSQQNGKYISLWYYGLTLLTCMWWKLTNWCYCSHWPRDRSAWIRPIGSRASVGLAPRTVRSSQPMAVCCDPDGNR